MHFKRGAFLFEAPIKIHGFEIISGDINPTWNLLTTVECLFLQLSRYDYKLIVHEFDNYDPKYTLDRHGLKHGDIEKNIELTFFL